MRSEGQEGRDLTIPSEKNEKNRVSKNPRLFKELLGFTVAEFDELYQKTRPVWAASEIQRLSRRKRQRAIGGGRTYALGLKDRLLMTLMWLKLYLSTDALGTLFGVDKSTASRNVRSILTILRQLGNKALGWPVPPKRGQTLNIQQALRKYPGLMAIVDVTDGTPGELHLIDRQQRIRRAADVHAQIHKPQIVINKKGRISEVMVSMPKRVHSQEQRTPQGLKAVAEEAG